MQPRNLPCCISVTNDAPLSLQPLRVGGGGVRHAQLGGDRGARERQQHVARVRGQCGCRRRMRRRGRSRSVDMMRLVKRKRAVADDAVAVAGGVARIAQVEQFRREAVPARGQHQAVDRRAAAGLLVRNVDAQIEDGLRGGAVDGLRVGVAR